MRNCWMSGSVDPDNKTVSAASNLGLYGLIRPACRNTWSMYDNLMKSNPPSEIILDPPLSVVRISFSFLSQGFLLEFIVSPSHTSVFRKGM